MDTRRHLDLDCLARRRSSLSRAGLAGLVDDLARAPAARTDRLGLHLTEDRPLHLDHTPRAPAARTACGMAAVCGPAAPAVVAGRKSIVGYGLRTARSRLLERDAQRDAHVTSTRPRRPACGAHRSPTKERLEDVADAKAASEDVRHVNVVRPKAARAVRRAKAVVVRALALVRENRVGLVDLLELTLGVRRLVDVRVERPRLLEKRALDRLCVGVMLNAEDLIVVRTRCQSHHSPESSVCCRTNAPRDSPSGNERPPDTRHAPPS